MSINAVQLNSDATKLFHWCCQVLEELALDAELNILQSYDRAVGRGKQHKQAMNAAETTAADSESGLWIYTLGHFIFR